MTLDSCVNDCLSVFSGKMWLLRSKFLTSKAETRGGRQKLPYVFTEQGVYMLMTVLKGDLATRQSKALVRAFKEMKDLIIDSKSLIGQSELLLLSVQTTQNTSDIAEIKANMVTKANLFKVTCSFNHIIVYLLRGIKFDAALKCMNIKNIA